MTRSVYTNRWWRGFEDVNGITYQRPTLSIYVGTEIHFRAKTHTTTKWDTKHKVKYSPNKDQGYYRDEGNGQTREKQKRLFLKILKENGLK